MYFGFVAPLNAPHNFTCKKLLHHRVQQLFYAYYEFVSP